MTESFSVSEMQTHAQALRGVDTATQSVATAAGDLGIGDWKMYGLFISPLACGVLSIADAAHGGTIDELARVTDAVAEGFDTTAKLYEATEKSNVDLSRAISDQIDSMDRRSRR